MAEKEYLERGMVLELLNDVDRCGYLDASDINSIPAADVAPVRHGRWLPQRLLGRGVWDCSECKTFGSPHWKRCPVCEAKMDLEGGNT